MLLRHLKVKKAALKNKSMVPTGNGMYSFVLWPNDLRCWYQYNLRANDMYVQMAHGGWTHNCKSSQVIFCYVTVTYAYSCLRECIIDLFFKTAFRIFCKV